MGCTASTAKGEVRGFVFLCLCPSFVFFFFAGFFFNDDDDDDDESLLNVFGFESNWIPRDDHRVQFC